MSISWQLDGDPRPALLVLPRDADSLDEAHAAIELWEHYKRRKLDDTQRLTVEVMMATRAGGLWAAATTGREMPRQNGKGDEVEVVELWGLVQRAERILHTVHDAVLLATESQSRLLDGCIEGHADLRRLKLRAWRGTGQQMIEMRNGGIIWYRTRTGGGARGVDEVDRIVVDEAQHAEEEHIAAITPTQLASANPQLNALGSAGISGKSVWWWRQRKRAASGDSGSFGYVGHTAEVVKFEADGRLVRSVVDVADHDVWRQANPALASGRVGLSFFEEQYQRLGPELFAREHLGVWDPEPDSEAEQVVTLTEWRALIDAQSTIITQPKIALEVSLDRKWAAFGAAGRRADGLMHVEQIERNVGTGWVLAKAEQFEARYGAIHVQSGSPAHALTEPMREAGRRVIEVSKTEHAQALGQFLDLVAARGLRHLDQADLDAAVAVARIQNAGDVGVWGRRSTKADISSLVAVTLALGQVPEPVKTPPKKARLLSL